MMGFDAENSELKIAAPKVFEMLPIRVAFLTNYIPPYSVPVLRHLSSSVSSFRIFVSTAMEADRSWEPNWEGLDVVRQRTITLRREHRSTHGFAMTYFRHFPYDTLAQMRDYKPDVIVSAQLGFRTLQAITFRFFNPFSRLVIWVDGSERTENDFGRNRTMVRRAFLRAADAVIVNGSSGARYVKRLDIPPERTVEVPFVSCVPETGKLGVFREPCVRRRLLYVGQLIERKGLYLLLEELVGWAREHRSENCSVWFVGDGPLRKSIEHAAWPPNVRATFFGDVAYSDLASFYADSGILVLPCLADTWGLVVNEALEAGLPVLGSLYSQAVEELVRDGVNGWTFLPDRSEDFRRALNRALSTTVPELNRMGENARNSVKHLTPQHSSERFLRAVRIALGTENGART